MKIYYILILVIILSACRPPFNKEKELDCIIPVPQCQPTKWNGESIDTSYYNSNKNYYYQIKQVEGLNTEKQEYAIHLNESVYSIENKQKAKFATIDVGGVQRIFHITNGYDPTSNTSVRDKYKVGEDIAPNIEGNIGFPIYYNKPNSLIISSTIKSNSNQYEYDLSGRKLQNLESTIGQSRLFELKNQKLNEIITELSSPKPHLIWEAQATLDRRNNVLFFASDREGGFGGVDIWYMVESNGKWMSPINCGETVNSPCDEVTPFVAPNSNTLYFSTTGRENVGGYDIFKAEYSILSSEFKNIQFQKNATNVGAPINTPSDELSPSFLNYPESYFYYSSDQDGEFDIYVLKKIFKEGKDSIEIEDEEKPDDIIDFTVKEDSIEINPTFELEGVVKDNRTDKPIENVDVSVRKDKDVTPHKTTKTDDKGIYKFELEKGHQYDVKVEDDSLFYDSYNVFVDKNDTINTIKKDLVLDEVKTVRINFEYDKSDKPYKFILDSLGNQINITWQEAIDNLATDISKSQSILEKVIITGHTDPVASQTYNMQLGQKRAEFVVSQLVKKGIPIYLLKANSKGESEKLVKFDDEEEDQYHKRLRRVTLQKVFIK